MDISKLFLNMTLFGSEWVLYLLVLLSVVSFSIIIERSIVLVKTRSDVFMLNQILSKVLTGSSIKETLDTISSMHGMEATILKEGLSRSESGTEAVEEIFNGLIGLAKIQMERGVSFLGTVGSNSPFIGLFGTVLGIIKAFHDLSANKTGGAEIVMSGISEALVATAVGLLVAIPAVISYNFFQRRIKQRIAHLTALIHLTLAGMKASKTE